MKLFDLRNFNAALAPGGIANVAAAMKSGAGWSRTLPAHSLFAA